MNNAVIHTLFEICPVLRAGGDGALEFIPDPFAASIHNEIDFSARIGPKKIKLSPGSLQLLREFPVTDRSRLEY